MDVPSNYKLTIITLWRGGWSVVQQAVLDYLLNEEFPDKTLFLWTVEPGAETERILEEAWHVPSQADQAMQMILIPGAVGKLTHWQKHQRVADLYNAVLHGVTSRRVLLVEDDVVACVGDYARLEAERSMLPPDTAVLMGAYRSRFRPERVCACGDQGYFPWSSETSEPRAAHWTGGGFTLYDNSALQSGLPLAPELCGQTVQGWDVTLCRRIRNNGGKVFVSGSVKVEHRCPEVLKYLGENQKGTVPH